MGYNQAMKLIDKQKRQIRDYFRSRPEVAAVYVYGSQVSGRAGPLSDVDLGVLLKKQVRQDESGDLQLEYIGAVQDIIKIDLAADVKLLNQDDSLAYLAEVLGKGELLVVNDKAGQEEFAHRVAMLYPDFYPVLQQYYAVMEQRIMEGTYAA